MDMMNEHGHGIGNFSCNSNNNQGNQHPSEADPSNISTRQASEPQSCYLDSQRQCTSAEARRSSRPIWRDSSEAVILKNIPKDVQLGDLDITRDEW